MRLAVVGFRTLLFAPQTDGNAAVSAGATNVIDFVLEPLLFSKQRNDVLQPSGQGALLSC